MKQCVFMNPSPNARASSAWKLIRHWKLEEVQFYVILNKHNTLCINDWIVYSTIRNKTKNRGNTRRYIQGYRNSMQNIIFTHVFREKFCLRFYLCTFYTFIQFGQRGNGIWRTIFTKGILKALPLSWKCAMIPTNQI